MAWRRLLAPLGRSVCVAVALLALLQGCLHQDRPIEPRSPKWPLMIPEPRGTFVHGWQDAQAAKAEASDFVFFLDEWYMSGDRLGPSGSKHLLDIVKRLPEVPFPVLIQVDMSAQLNEARRQTVVALLTQHGVPDAEQRVVLGYPEAEGLFGEEAERIYPQMLRGSYGQRFRSGFGGYGGYGGYGGFGSFGGYGSTFGRPGGFVAGPYGF